MNNLTEVLIETLRAAGLTVTHEATEDEQHRVTAIDPDTQETHIVTGPDLYEALCKAAEGVGFELEDD